MGPERYRAFDIARFPLGGNQELVYSSLTGAARTLPAFGVRLLQGCRTFAPLDHHAAALCRELNLPAEQIASLRSQLAQFAEAGLLVSTSQVLRSGADSTAPPEVPSPIASIAVPTRNRTPALERCLVSVVEAGRRHGRTNDFVVADDSDSSQTREANRQLLQSLGTRYGVNFYYAGPEEKLRFAQRLSAHAGLPADVVRFGLLNEERRPTATGANRNALLLHTVGEVVLQVDDDTVCCPAPVPGMQSGLRLSSLYDPTEFWFFAEEEPVLPPGGFVDTDLLGQHERLLGKSVGSCLSVDKPSSDLELDTAGTGFFQKLRSGPGRVLVTAVGVIGDSGMGSAAHLLALDGDARARLLRNERIYRHALVHHRLMRGVPRTTLCDGAVCMALNLGLDNRQLLPPFLPLQRNQDGVFAALLRSCFPDAFQGFLPWMVLHQPPKPRPAVAFEPGQAVIRLQSSHVLQALIGSFLAGPGCPDSRQRLRALGKTLVALGSTAVPDFQDLIRLQLWSPMSRLAMRLQGLLEKYQGQPAFWANDLQKALAALRVTLPAPQFGLPSDLVVETPDGDALTALQRLIYRFGQLLEIWPDMVDAARELRARNIRVADPI